MARGRRRERINLKAFYESYILPALDRMTVEQFQKLYYGLHTQGGTWRNTYWLGVPIMKCPLDLWLYQEMIYEVRPDVIIECGTAFGASALYLASICEIVGNGTVITVDTDVRPNRPDHARIIYITGSSTDPTTVEKIKERIPPDGSVMVILDSDHSKDHVLRELYTYGGMVTPGSYLVVEDTILNGHPVVPDHGPGPMEAMREYLQVDRSFLSDRGKGKFLMTFNAKGYLKKINL